MPQPVHQALQRCRDRWLPRSVVSGILSGMAASVTVYETPAFPYPHASTTDAMRGDWMKIGADISTVMARQIEEAEAK